MQFIRFDRSARALRLLSLTSAVLLAACGGGGSDGSGSTDSSDTSSGGGDTVQAPADPAPTGPTLNASRQRWRSRSPQSRLPTSNTLPIP